MIDAATRTERVGAEGGINTPIRHWPSVLVTLYLLAVLLPFTFSIGPLQMTSVRIFVLVMFFPLAWRLISGRAGRMTAIDMLMALHIGWATVALAVNNPEQVIQQSGSVGMEFIGGYLVGRTLVRNRDEFTAVARFLVLAIICVLPLVVYESITGESLTLALIRSLPGLGAPVDLNIGRRMGLDRVQFTFVHPIHFGLFCSVVFSLCFVGLKGVMSDVRRIMSAVIIAISGFLALSSGAFLAIVLQFSLILWAFVFRDMRQRWRLLLGMFALAYIFIDLVSNRPPIRVFMTYATFSAHTAYWRMTIFDWGMVNVWSNPIFGIGLNEWVRPSWMHSGSVDNFWLLMAMRYGIPGFLLLAAGYLIALFRVMARDFSSNPALNQVRLAWVFTFVGLTFTLFTVHVWLNVYSFVFFMFGAGIWLIDASPDEGSSREIEDAGMGQVASLEHRRSAPVYTRFPGRIAAQTMHRSAYLVSGVVPDSSPTHHLSFERPPDRQTNGPTSGERG